MPGKCRSGCISANSRNPLPYAGLSAGGALPQEKTPSPQTGMPLLGNLAQFRPKGLLSGLDGDTMLILAMMVMLYKDGGWDGCDKKLLMALAYLLT